jgi:hypothetical protein
MYPICPDVNGLELKLLSFHAARHNQSAEKAFEAAGNGLRKR